MALSVGIAKRVWSVATGPYQELILFVDDAAEVVHQLGDPVPAAESVPQSAAVAIEGVLERVLGEARSGKGSETRTIMLPEAGRELFFRAQAVAGDSTSSQHITLRVGRVLTGTNSLHASVRVAQRAESFDSLFEQIASNLDTVFWMADAGAFRLLYVSPPSATVLGIPAEELQRNPDLWMQNILPEDQGPVVRAMRDSGIQNFSAEYRYRKPDGTVVWLRASTFPIRDEEGMVIRVGGLATDITRRKVAELRLVEQVERDSLTQALNRRGLGRVLSDLRVEGAGASAILLDCDNFQQINDRFGHAAGDVVLRQVAERISRTLRPEDVLGRVGGDEFVAILKNTPLEEAAEMAERLRVAVAQTHLRMGNEVASVSASFGVAEVEDEVVVDQLLHRLGSAVRTGKKLGKNRVVGAHSEAPPPLASVDVIRDSLLRGDGLRVVAQPIRRVSSGEPVAYELLARRDAQDPLREPKDFFAFATEQSIVTSVDLKCLGVSLGWARAHAGGLDVHVNLYPSTLLELVPDTLPQVFGSADLRRIHVEIIEEQFIGDPEYLVENVRALQGLGAKIVLDDIGFGQSSLEALVVLEPDGVKLDRRMIRGAFESAERRRHLERLVCMMRAIGGDVVAEGIETESDLRVVQDLGIEFGQGFLWDRPG